MGLKDLFRVFVHGYIACGHTVSIESEEELGRLIKEYVDDLKDDFCFAEDTMEDLLDYIEHNISDENKGLYTLHFDKHYYIHRLEEYLRHIIKSYEKNNKNC